MANLPVLEEPPHSRNLLEETEGACLRAPGQCPATACRFHMFEPRAKLGPAGETCAIKLADGGPLTLDEVGQAMGVTRERVRQIQNGALAKVATKLRLASWPLEDIAQVLAANQPRG